MSYIVHLRQKLRLIGQYALPILVVTAMISSPDSAIATTPYDETFEDYAVGTPLVDGINGWYGTSSDIIVTNIVHTNFSNISTNLAMIPADCTLSNRCESTSSLGIWMQFDANLAFYNGAYQPEVDTNTSIMLYVNTNGYFVVHNGAPVPSTTNSVNWVVLTTNAAGQAITPLSTNTSVRINVHQNYATKSWALYADNVLLTNAIGFINTALTNFTGFDLRNGNTTSYLDNVHISDWWTVMEVSPTNISREIWQGQDAGSNQVEVWNNNGTNALAFTVSYTNYDVSTNWLSVTPVTGTNYGSTQKSALWVRMDTANLPPRTNAYEAAVQVTGAPGTTNSPQVVRVTVLVQGIGLWVSPTNFPTKAVTVGQADVFDELNVANTGAAPRGTISYTVTTTNTWLSVSPTNGNVQNDVSTVNLRYLTLTTNLSAGWYTGQVDVVALGVRTQTVGVVLRMNHRPGVAWDAGSKVWTNEVMAGDSIAGTNIAVWNASGTPAGQMNYTMSVNDPSGLGWASVSPASGSSTGNQQAVTVSYATAGLAAGVYTAQLRVTGVDNATGEATTNGPLYMGLQLTVKGTPALKTDVTSLSQTVLENNTGTNSFLVWNEGSLPRGGMRYTVTPDVSWVTLSPATGVVTNDVNTVQVIWGTTGTTLPPGVYNGNLIVDAFDAQTSLRAGGAPITLPLALTVTARTPLNLELPTVVGAMYAGQTVEANVGLWQNQARLTFGYQWATNTTKTGEGHNILGATGSNYVITAADRGKYLRVGVTATDSNPTPKSSTANSAWTNAAKVKALQEDFNGDGITDLWVYNELTGAWYANFGEASSATGIFPGRPGMIAAPGDYDGDGNEDLGVYEPAHGMWHIYYLPRGDYAYGSLFGGTAEEAAATPVTADFDGDGATDVGLYYMGYWAIRYSIPGSVSVVEPFADTWSEPVLGDWDGDGITELGVYNGGVWTLRMGSGSVTEQEFGGGGLGVLPAPADYDADGSTDLGVYDVSANQWRWRESRSGFEQSVSFGSGGTDARPGHYDHDRSNDWAQVHMSADNDFIVWEVKRTTETNFLYRGQSFQQSTDRWRVSW